MKKVKKIVALVLSLNVLCCLCVTFAGCRYEDVIKDLYEQVEELQTQLETQQGTINQQQATIAKQQDSIDELEKEKNSLAGAVDKLRKENINLANRIDGLEQQAYSGNFYTLAAAHGKGWLTQEDLLSIAYYNHDGNAHNTELMGENYHPIAKTPEKLSEKQELVIKQALADWLNSKTSDTINADNVLIWGYYGTYNGGVALMLGYAENGNDIFAARDVISKYPVGGVTFYYSQYIEFLRMQDFVLCNQIIYFKGQI